MEQVTDSCLFLHDAAVFAARHSIGDTITPGSLQPLVDIGGIPEKTGKWPVEFRSARCNRVCDGRVVARVEYDELASDVAWHGGCIVLKAAQAAQAAKEDSPT